jgi:DNA repair protein RadA/Sms
VAAPAGAVVVGELGLGGELRPAPRLEERLRAAAQLGFTSAFVPAASVGGGGGAGAGPGAAPPQSVVHGVRVVAVRNVRDAVAAALPAALR